ncbi:xanthine dehydrogenase subunit XdhB [Thermodesulfobacteriota bacterium]
MYNFESYAKADSVSQAVQLLNENPGASLIAGGTDVLINLHEGKNEFRSLVDIHDLPELKNITLSDSEDIIIGSGVSFTGLAETPMLSERIPMLVETVSTVAGPQLRNMATIGGNICNGMTSADSAPPFFALNAILTIQGINGDRDISIKDFYLGPGKVAIDPREVLKAITITRENYEGFSGHYHKYAMRDAMDIATIGCAAVCKLQDDIIKDLRIAYGVAGPVPLRCGKAEEHAIGNKFSEDLLNEISEIVIEDLNPRGSWRASKEFRLHIIKTLAVRVVEQTIIKAGGKFQ